VVATQFAPANHLQSERGDPEAAFAAAPVKVDQTYVTPAETHNPSSYTRRPRSGMIHIDAVRGVAGVFNLQGILAQMFGLPRENVRVITKFLGSGFGGKLCRGRIARRRRRRELASRSSSCSAAR